MKCSSRTNMWYYQAKGKLLHDRLEITVHHAFTLLGTIIHPRGPTECEAYTRDRKSSPKSPSRPKNTTMEVKGTKYPSAKPPACYMSCFTLDIPRTRPYLVSTTLHEFNSHSPTMTRTVLVLGATGTQGKMHNLPWHIPVHCHLTVLGGSVAKLLLQHPEQYIVRCLTRNPGSEKAQILASQGARLVKADLTVPSTLSSAFEGVWGVFAVTDFYDTVFQH